MQKWRRMQIGKKERGSANLVSCGKINFQHSKLGKTMEKKNLPHVAGPFTNK